MSRDDDRNENERSERARKRARASRERGISEEIHYEVDATVDLSQVENLDPDRPLRVAAVRNGEVLASTSLRPSDASGGSLQVELEFGLEGPVAPVRIRVGRGDVPRRQFLGMKALDRSVASREWELDRKQGVATLSVDELVVPDDLYVHWGVVCREYTIRGRVVCRKWRFDSRSNHFVFEDHAVPGATVEALEVDRFFFLYFRDTVGTAVTDVDGYFELSFTWCCRFWYPFPGPWVVDPDLLDRIRDRLRVPLRPELPPLPDPPPVDPFELEEYLRELAQVRTGAEPLKLSAETPASGQALKRMLPEAPELEALHVWPWHLGRDCGPDILFRVTQPCGGSVEVIYSEDDSETRWNIPTSLNVVLEADENACCIPPPSEPPAGDCLAITKAGCVTVDKIGLSAGPPDLRGYAYPGSLDRPFAGTVLMRGEFGDGSYGVVDYYRVQVQEVGVPGWTFADDVPGLLGSIGRRYVDPAAFPPPYLSPAISFGPTDFLGDGNRYYRTIFKYERDNTASEPSFGWIWTNRPHLFRINTAKLPGGDGLYRFRVVGYEVDENGQIVEQRTMPLCGAEEDATVMLRVDNRNVPHPPSTATHPCGPDVVHTCTAEPDCDVIKVVKNEGQPSEEIIDPCEVATIGDSDSVSIHFMATSPSTVEDAHLGGYTFRAHYGESAFVNLLAVGTLSGVSTPRFGPTYAAALTQGATRPHWSGGEFKVVVPGSEFPISCAYLLRLRAWKRSFSGCGSPRHVHRNVTEYSFCVVKDEG